MVDDEGGAGLRRHFWLPFVWWFALATFGVVVVLLLFGTPLGNALLLGPVIAGLGVAVGVFVSRRGASS